MTVSGSTVSDDGNGIVTVSVDRAGTQPSTIYRVRQLTVSGTTEVLGTRWTGIVTYDDPPVFSPEYQNVFGGQPVHGGRRNACVPLGRNSQTMTLPAWRTLGND